MTRYCMRCDQPILKDEPYRTVDKYSSSGAGSVLYVHVRRCKPVLTQTAPAQSW